MYNEWIRVLPNPEPLEYPRALTRRPCNEVVSTFSLTDPNRSYSPSMITFSQSVPNWLRLGKEYTTRSQNVCSATIKSIDNPENLTLWINVLDMSYGPQPTANVDSRLDGVPLKGQDPLYFIPRVSYKLSDVVVIIGENLEEAADQYILWLHSCKGVFENTQPSTAIKPYAFVVVRDIPNKRTLQKDFQLSCLLSRKAQDLDRRDFEKLSGSLFECYRCLNSTESIAKEMLNSIKIMRRLREARKHLWSQSTFLKLRDYLVASLASNPQEPLNIVKALSADTVVQKASTDLWPEFIKLYAAEGNLDQYLEKFIIPIIGSCFARNALKQDHGKPCVIAAWIILIHVGFLAVEVFDNVYEHRCQLLFAKEPKRDQYVEHTKASMKHFMAAYEPRPNYYHFQKLRMYERYWTRTFSRKMCFGCLLCCCQVFLPCGHALCETCYRDVTSSGLVYNDLLTTNGSLKCQICPLCQKKLPNFSVTLSPPTSGGRVLALDGGGPLGLVTLKMLERFSNEIDLDVSIHEMFDLICGTSAGNVDLYNDGYNYLQLLGGIIAILLGKKRWTLEECINEFSDFATSLFTTPRSWLDCLGGWTATVRKALNFVREDCLYPESQVERIFRQAIGETTLMLGTSDVGFSPKVGVTTRSSKKNGGIITSYNRTNESSVPWIQSDNKFPDLQAWEA